MKRTDVITHEVALQGLIGNLRREWNETIRNLFGVNLPSARVYQRPRKVCERRVGSDWRPAT